MRRSFKVGVTAGALALAALLAIRGAALTPVSAESESFSDGQVQSIQKIVREYLVSHPEVLLEAQEAYEKQAEAKRGEAALSRMPGFYKQLASMKKELAPFTAGAQDGDVTMVEFFDYNCGYCRHTLPELIKLVDTDKRVKIQFIEFPILAPGSAEATKVAIAAANQGKYWEFHKAMFAAGRASKETALKVAEQIGLDMNKVQKDITAPETDALMAKFAELAKNMFIDGTPSFVVGDKLNPGAADADQLKQLVEDTRKAGCKSCVTDASAPGAKDEKKS
jgi:protein-disulfide isomerase